MKYDRIPWLKERTVLKDISIVLGWALGLILLAVLCWYFTQPLRNRFLVISINQVLEQSGDNRRVSEPIPMKNPRTFGLGRWYNFSGDTRLFLFTFIGEGTFFPCAAVMTPDGRVEEFIPMNLHGERILNRISPEIKNIYAQRINSQRIEEGRK